MALTHLLIMATQAQKAAAACARAARWPTASSANLDYKLSDNGQESLMALTHYPVLIRTQIMTVDIQAV